ncbi:dichloro-2,5-cyclohexadiene-1,4-diol dehydrogenase [Seminavis robusta]|uniref:Dichloro-2,5-cyclohexadiene-1,4-diol dehydrogenase n=1 Tax=Seminavis robusta TaxID=568900 RepID=A0A9N8GZI8_9STRA|nr:dichloro-2,5-cyclohexadiene-1,4-diol dehydrogenase [Seminavis robusta]|eukprot:Sro4_g003630.1 dichloro-2,5-cyclohexadiene-1,4-diol dehydrogenase (267) ;mRNA; f:208402-209310
MLSHIVGIVSGGASGLGAATAASLLKHGGKVVVADLPSQRAAFEQLAASVAGSSSALSFAEADVTNPDQIARALDMAEEQFGAPVNAAINCAGIGLARKIVSVKRGTDEVKVHPLEEFSKIMRVNVDGTFNVARLAAERMIKRENGSDGIKGCIINTASIAAYDGQIGQCAYGASKGAIASLTLPMARDLSSQGIRVMTIAPGLFQTPLLDGLPDAVKAELGATVPLPSRLGDPAEFGQLVVSILTNPMLNGEVIRLDGAIRMPPK